MISEAIARAQAKAPVDVEGLAVDLGLRVHRAYLEKDTSGELIRLGNGGFQINVNANDVLTRQRFTIAHELGHYIYHRNLIGAGLDDSKAYRSVDGGKYRNTAIGPREESEANRFASNLLMPESLLRPCLDEGLDVEALADAFQVSKQAMRVRLSRPAQPIL